MLVVFAVIAILVAIALPVYAKQREVAQESAVEQRLHLALRVARAASDLNGGLFPEAQELARRMQEVEPSLNVEVKPSLLAPLQVGPTYLIKSGTTAESILLAGKSEAGTLHTLFWEDGKSTYSRTRQPTYEELVLSLGPSAYWPLSTNLLDLSGNGWTLSPHAQGSIQAGGGNPLLLDEQGPSTFFDGGANSFFQSNYITRRNWMIYPRIDHQRTGWGATHNGAIQKLSVTDEWAPFGGYSLKSEVGPGDGKFTAVGTYGVGKIPVQPGEVLSGGMRLRVEGNWTHRLWIAFYDENGKFHSDSVQPNSYTTTQGDHWMTTEGRVVPEGAAYALLRVGGVAPVGEHFTVWIAGGIIERSATLTGPYFDGSGYVDESGQWVSQPNAQTGDRRTGWAGTPFASESAFGVFADGTQRTFIVWARAADIDNWRPMVGASNHYRLMDIRRTPGPNSSLEVSLGEQSFVYGGSWPGPNEPVMVALVVDEVSDKVEAYVNGRELPEIQKAWDWSKGAKEFFLIGYSAGSVPRWYGDLGHVAVFERALTPDQICSLWQAGSGKDC